MKPRAEGKHPVRAFVAGLPGVGKTTALAGVPVPIVKFGAAMHEAAVRQGFVGTKDDLRRLPDAELAPLRQAAMRALPPSFVLDGHLVIEDEGRIRSAIPDEFNVPGFLTHIVVLEAEPEELANRRAGRPGRDSGAPSHIANHQAQQRDAGAALAAATDARLQFLDTTRRSAAEVTALLMASLGFKKGGL